MSSSLSTDVNSQDVIELMKELSEEDTKDCDAVSSSQEVSSPISTGSETDSSCCSKGGDCDTEPNASPSVASSRQELKSEAHSTRKQRHPKKKSAYPSSPPHPNIHSIIHNEDALHCLLLATSRAETFQLIFNKKDRLSFLCLFDIRHVEKGEILVDYGDLIDAFYVIDEGAIEVMAPRKRTVKMSLEDIRNSDESNWIRETCLYENEHFGEPSLECAIQTRLEKDVVSPYRMRCAFPSRVWYLSARSFLERWNSMQRVMRKQIMIGIKRVPLLHAYLKEHPEEANRIVDSCKIVELAPDECVIRQFFRGRNMYVLLRGQAKRYQEDDKKNPLGSYIGEYSKQNGVFGMEAFQDEPFLETVLVSSRRCSLLVIPARVQE